MWKSKFLRVVHWVIIINFSLEVIYGLYMIFVVHGEKHLPLFAQAAKLPIETILRRRLYAVETWIALSGLCIYLGITEMLPERLRAWRLNKDKLEMD